MLVSLSFTESPVLARAAIVELRAPVKAERLLMVDVCLSRLATPPQSQHLLRFENIR